MDENITIISDDTTIDTETIETTETTIFPDTKILETTETTTFVFDNELNSTNFENSYFLCTSFLFLFITVILIMKGASNI